MANALYSAAKESFLKAEIDFDVDNIKAVLTRDVPDTANDQFLSDVASTVATSANLTGITTTGGVLDSTADVTFSAVASGAAINYLLLYQDTGVAASSRLIAAIDDAAGLPVTPNGGDIQVQWNASGIFAL